MKESGLNYFYGQLGLNTGSLGILYTFEEGAGVTLNSVSGGQSQYSATLSSSANFWVKPGSGFFSGNYAQVNNASGLYSITWSQVFVYEKVNTNPLILFSSLSGTSGYEIGVTAANKPYMVSFNQQPVAAASSNNLSSKNAIALTYQPNFLTINYFNFNAQAMETETFSLPFGITQSDSWRLGGTTGYFDLYAYSTDVIAPSVLAQWFSGLYAYPTGVGYATETLFSTGFTGYQAITVYTTGVTGYSISPGGDQGRDYYTGAFPTNFTQTTLTGILTSGLYYSGLSGVTSFVSTGAPFPLYLLLTGYASSFGMQKVQLYSVIETGDIVKAGFSYAPFNDAYNKILLRQYSGYLVDPSWDTGIINLFYNGVGQANSGWSLSGGYIILSGANVNDMAFLDLKSGDEKTFMVTGGLTGFAFTYTGQEIYLNGVNLISGRDFQIAGATLNLTNLNTGVSGIIFEYPIVLPYVTGTFAVGTGVPFQANTSAIYLNGVRQQNTAQYEEGAIFDLLSGSSFNPVGALNVYADTDLFWE